MSDALRQSTTDKIESKVTPNSQKSVLEQGMDTAKSGLDSAAATLQPESEKGLGQKASDLVSDRGTTQHDTKSNTQAQGQGILASVQDTVNSAVESASNMISGNTANTNTGSKNL